MFPVLISSIEEYNLTKQRGYEPLIDLLFFKMEIHTRVQIQHELFGGSSLNKGDVELGNQKYYHWCWEHKHHFNKCQNCFLPLPYYNAIFISHIEGRGSHSEMAYDPRNSNILCFDCHKKWENLFKRVEMAIYRENIYMIKLLRNDYNQLNIKPNLILHGSSFANTGNSTVIA